MMKKNLNFLLFFVGLFFSFGVQAETVQALFHQANDPMHGNPKGKVTIVEFFDYQCLHCGEMSPVVDAIIKTNPNVRVVFKDFPIRGPVSTFAAKAAIAAKMQGKYYQFSRAMLVSKYQLTQNSILKIAKANGLDVTKLKRDMESPTVKNQIRANMQLADQLKLNGTPAFFIGRSDAKSTDNINFVLGGMTKHQMQQEINALR